MVSENSDTKFLIQSINKLKKEKNAIILVHNYQEPDIYLIADHIGDSLNLSKKAAEADADIIVFCGVHFMAETAKILNPDKMVLLPSREAGCSMADMAGVDELLFMKKQYPDAAVVSYINTTAAIKAHTDVCCTSANAVQIVNSLPNEQIIFLPDKNLGNYVQSKTDKDIIIWDGYCAIHDNLDKDMLLNFKGKVPTSKIIAHPECKEEILDISDHVCGTGGMASYARKDETNDFIVVTECGMTEKLRQDVPEKSFHALCNICPFMKMTTLSLVERSLKKLEYQIEIPESIIEKARKSIDRMLETS